MTILTERRLLAGVAFLGALGVMAGAFGSHGLKGLVTPERLVVWQTAVHYQMLHVLAAGGLLLSQHQLVRWPRCQWPVTAWLVGILIFSGSLYALVLTDTPVLGAITPVGGLLLIAGWLLLAALALKGASRVEP